MTQKKRVVFCTFSSIYSSIVLKKLLSEDSIEVVSILNSKRILSKKYNSILGALKQIQLTGFRYSSYLFMVTDLFESLQNLSIVNNKNTQSINKIAKQNKIPIIQTRDINIPESIEFIKKNKADYLLAAHFNQRIQDEVLNNSGLECLNIHPSLLPSYQGVDPVFYTLLDSQRETGVTLHKMNEKFDSGEKISQSLIEIKQDDSLLTLNQKLFDLGAELAMDYIVHGKTSMIEGDNKLIARYDSWPSKKQVKALKAKGVNLTTLKHYFGTLRRGL